MEIVHAPFISLWANWRTGNWRTGRSWTPMDACGSCVSYWIWLVRKPNDTATFGSYIQDKVMWPVPSFFYRQVLRQQLLYSGRHPFKFCVDHGGSTEFFGSCWRHQESACSLRFQMILRLKLTATAHGKDPNWTMSRNIHSYFLICSTWSGVSFQTGSFVPLIGIVLA